MSSVQVRVQDQRELAEYGVSVGAFSRVEIPELGRVIVDGYELDLRGVTDDNTEWPVVASATGDLFSPSKGSAVCALFRFEDGTYEVLVIGVKAAADMTTPWSDVSDNTYQSSELPVYPVWPTGESESGQTVTETDADAQAPETDAEFVARKKAEVTEVARLFDSGLQTHWPRFEVRVDNVLANLSVGVNPAQDSHRQGLARKGRQKMDNVCNWGRLYIGYVWKQLNGLSGNMPVVQAAVTALINRLKQDFPNAERVRLFYLTHDVDDWTTKETEHEIWNSRVENGAIVADTKVYDIRDANLVGGVYTAAAASATLVEFEDLVITQYNAALKG